MTARLVLLAALLGSMSWGQPASAQGSGRDAVAAARAAARPLAKRAYESFESGDYGAAIELFREAELHFHAPPHLLYVARAQAHLDHLVEARDTYLLVASEKLERYAPDPFHKAQESARVELEQLRARIPKVHIQVTGARRGDVKLWIDHQLIEDLLPVHELNPGPHSVRAEASSGGSLTRELVLAEGAREELVLEFQPRPTHEPKVNDLLVPALVSFGLGGAGLAVGIAAGIVSLNTVSDIEDQCVDGHCPPASETEADHAMLLGNLSTVGFVVAGVGAAAGATLLILGMPEDGEPVAVAVRARLGLGAAHFEIAF